MGRASVDANLLAQYGSAAIIARAPQKQNDLA
jgi:hypothetical protein